MSHHGSGGIQNHSIGQYYPAGTYIKSGLEPGGTIVAWNLVTGEIYGEVEFNDWEENYYAAHAYAESLIPENVPYRNQQRQHVAEAAPSKDVSNVRRNSPMSKYTVAPEDRLFTDKFIKGVNPRRILADLVSFYAGVVEADQVSWVEFQNSEHVNHPECVAYAENSIALNRSIFEGLANVLDQGDEGTQAIREADGQGDGGFADLLSQLGIDVEQLQDSGVAVFDGHGVEIGNRS